MLNFHKKEEKFLEAIRKTSQSSGFSEILIEKDYYCSLQKKHLIGDAKAYIKINDILSMVKHKLKVLSRRIDLSDERKKEFLSQMETGLKPVLRQKDFEEFNFEQAWKWLKILEQKISKA